MDKDRHAIPQHALEYAQRPSDNESRMCTRKSDPGTRAKDVERT